MEKANGNGPKSLAHEIKHLEQFVRQILAARDTPAIIRTLAKDGMLLAVCRKLVSTHPEKEPLFWQNYRLVCRKYSVDPAQLAERLHPPARSLGLTDQEAQQTDYYALLGVELEATADDIRRAYHQKAKTLHPDTGASAEADETAFIRINDAYQVLKDPLLRQHYDESRRNQEKWCEYPVCSYVDTKESKEAFKRKRLFTQFGGLVLGLLLATMIFSWLYENWAYRDGLYETLLDEKTTNPVETQGLKKDVEIKSGSSRNPSGSTGHALQPVKGEPVEERRSTDTQTFRPEHRTRVPEAPRSNGIDETAANPKIKSFYDLNDPEANGGEKSSSNPEPARLPASEALKSGQSFSISDIVKITADDLSLRVSPGIYEPVIRQIDKEEVGQILEGPKKSDGYTWWKIGLTRGNRGWAAERKRATIPQFPEGSTSNFVAVYQKKSSIPHVQPEIQEATGVAKKSETIKTGPPQPKADDTPHAALTRPEGIGRDPKAKPEDGFKKSAGLKETPNTQQAPNEAQNDQQAVSMLKQLADEEKEIQDVRAFVKGFARIYEQRDLTAFSQLFLKNATDNGIHFSKKTDAYKQSFRQARKVAYNIDLRRFSLLIDKQIVQTEGVYQISWVPSTGHRKQRTGTVSFELVKQNGQYFVKNYNYRVEKMK